METIENRREILIELKCCIIGFYDTVANTVLIWLMTLRFAHWHHFIRYRNSLKKSILSDFEIVADFYNICNSRMRCNTTVEVNNLCVFTLCNANRMENENLSPDSSLYNRDNCTENT